MKHIFITGIGTEVGKTVAAAIATQALGADYWKPIQSGDLEKSDTLKVKNWICNSKSFFHPEAYRLQTPLSPHASAEIDGITINLEEIKRPLTDNYLIIEGAGGLLVPLNHKDNIADLMQPSDKIILVTKHYLGSINHTLLSYHYLISRGYTDIAIWINGEASPSSEKALKKQTNAFFIERILPLPALSQKNIEQEARRVKESLLAFIYA